MAEKTSKKKAVVSPKSTPAKKSAPKETAPKTAEKKAPKPAAKPTAKPAPKSAPKPASKPAQKTKQASKPAAKPVAPPLDVTKMANATLKLLDQAAEVLRKTVTTGAKLSDKAQVQATARAHSLLEKAHGGLKAGLDKIQSLIP